MRVDMHIHSIYSPDGVMDIKYLLKIARKKGLDGVAITDHNEIRGALKARKMKIITVIPGIEISTKDGHILAYGIECKIPRGMEIGETIDKIHECGGIAIAAHPYRFWSGIGEKNTRANHFDGIEVFNSRCKERSNLKARRLRDELRIGMSAGSDAHYPEEVGRGGIVVNSSEHILEDVLHGNVNVFGTSRDFKGTIKYVKKAVIEWIGRGFKKI